LTLRLPFPEARFFKVSHIKIICLVLALAGLLSGCAKPPQSQAELTTQALPSQPVAGGTDQSMPSPLTAEADASATPPPISVARVDEDGILAASIGSPRLAGRTLRIGSLADLGTLRPGEVILTFDDGPNPNITPKILKALDKYGVKAVFFMVGKMARAYPETAELVARAGHTVGSHSHGHENFRAVGYEAAMESVTKAKAEIAAALKPAGKKPAPFFRFPYMNETRTLRADLTESGLVIFGIDVDSWDYLSQTPEQITKRTLKRLDERGRGIILFHDIHARTAKLLPGFLDELKKRGYTVVRAIPKTRTLMELIYRASAR
jgi:peptidoglycan-N-acetylglucosamine deacetylase